MKPLMAVARGILIAPLLALGPVSLLSAHALLVDSVPKADASLPAPPQLVLKFNSRIEARLSSVLLVGGPRNARVLLMNPDATAADTLVYSLRGRPVSGRVEGLVGRRPHHRRRAAVHGHPGPAMSPQTRRQR